MLRGVWQALNCLSIHATHCVIIAGASPGETKMWAAVRENRRFFAFAVRITGKLLWKLGSCGGPHIVSILMIDTTCLFYTCVNIGSITGKFWTLIQGTPRKKPLKWCTCGVEEIHSVGTINNVETSYFTQLKICYLMSMFQCPWDILIMSWLFTARWCTCGLLSSRRDMTSRHNSSLVAKWLWYYEAVS